MPNRQTHEALDKLVLGKKYTNVHKILDLPSLWLGERHRLLFHDEATAMLIGFLVDGNGGAVSALLHVLLDRYKGYKNFK